MQFIEITDTKQVKYHVNVSKITAIVQDGLNFSKGAQIHVGGLYIVTDETAQSILTRLTEFLKPQWEDIKMTTKLKPEAGKEFTYVMTTDLHGLLATGGMEGLNDMMDNDFHDTFGYGLILTDISYKPVGVDNENNILLEVSGLVDSY